jgi:hypothetical protein
MGEDMKNKVFLEFLGRHFLKTEALLTGREVNSLKKMNNETLEKYLFLAELSKINKF